MNDDGPPFENILKQTQKDQTARAFAAHPTPEGLLNIGIEALEAAEFHLKRFHDGDQAEAPLACARGCTFCCHQYVGLSVPELAVLAKFITSRMNRAGQTRLLARLSEVALATLGMGHFERASSHIDCPLLDPESRRCTVYVARPLTCRGMHSLSREACEEDDVAPGRTRPIPQYASHKAVTRSIAIGLQLGLAERGAQVSELELTAALRQVLERPEMFQRWIGGEAIFKGVVVPPA